MSQPTDTNTTVLSSVEKSEEVAPKQSFIQRRLVTPIKNHPKIALAIGGGLALVGAAAYAGRATAPDNTSDVPTLESDVEQVEEAEDTPVA